MSQRLSDGARALKAFIEKHQLTQLMAARALGVTDPAVHDWLAGTKRPRPQHRASIEVWTGGVVGRDSWLSKRERAELAVVRPFVPRTGTSG